MPETDTVEHNWVTDPYSVGLSTNSERSLLVDLDSRSVTPPGWQGLRKPRPVSPQAQSIYELHERDFSISDPTVPARLRGTYGAFAVSSSHGMKHLRALAAAGLTTVHLMPVNDIATIEERRDQQQVPSCDLESLPPAGEQQQECVMAVAGQDGFNWGYDPLHYTTPEGSYATDPDGGARTLEFRTMVAGPQPGRPARGDRRRLQPHLRLGPERAQQPRPHRPGLLPPARPAARVRGDVDVLLQHRDRAHHDGQADGRLGAHLGHGLQGRRLPVRPDGPPAQGGHGRAAAAPGPADPAARRGRRQGYLPLRRGLELRRGGERRPLRAGDPAQHGRHRHRHLQRPAARRRARRRAPSTTTHGCRASAAGCSPTPTATRSTAPPTSRRRDCCWPRT